MDIKPLISVRYFLYTMRSFKSNLIIYKPIFYKRRELLQYKSKVGLYGVSCYDYGEMTSSPDLMYSVKTEQFLKEEEGFLLCTNENPLPTFSLNWKINPKNLLTPLNRFIHIRKMLHRLSVLKPILHLYVLFNRSSYLCVLLKTTLLVFFPYL